MGHFWGFQTDESSVEKQCQLTAELNMRDLRPVSVSLYPNLLCVAPFKDGQQLAKYYRAKILHILDSNVEVPTHTHNAPVQNKTSHIRNYFSTYVAELNSFHN